MQLLVFKCWYSFVGLYKTFLSELCSKLYQGKRQQADVPSASAADQSDSDESWSIIAAEDVPVLEPHVPECGTNDGRNKDSRALPRI